MKSKYFVFLLIVIALLLASCSSKTDNTTSPTAQETQASTNEAYPPAGSIPESQPAGQLTYPYPGPYPGPNPTAISHQPTIDYNAMPYVPPEVEPPSTATPSVPIVVPTPRADLGIVVGKLLSTDNGNPPYLATLYLGSTIEADKADFPPLVSLDETTDPKATQDESGAFVFIDIKPGIYAVIVWDPYTSIVIQDEKKENYLTFEVKAGEITDLGTILYP